MRSVPHMSHVLRCLDGQIPPTFVRQHIKQGETAPDEASSPRLVCVVCVCARCACGGSVGVRVERWRGVDGRGYPFPVPGKGCPFTPLADLLIHSTAPERTPQEHKCVHFSSGSECMKNHWGLILASKSLKKQCFFDSERLKA